MLRLLLLIVVMVVVAVRRRRRRRRRRRIMSLACQTPGVKESVQGLIGPVSASCDLVRTSLASIV